MYLFLGGGRGEEVLFPSFRVRSSGGGWSLGEGAVSLSFLLLSGARRGGVELVNQISGKRERSVRTWARARHGMRGVGVGGGWWLKLGVKAGGFKPCFGKRTRCRRDVFLIRMMVTGACGKTFGFIRWGGEDGNFYEISWLELRHVTFLGDVDLH